jgi:hypothetical protein
MDQPTAENALRRLEALVGRWTLEATVPGGDPWPGDAWASFEWHESGLHLVERSAAQLPEAPSVISIIGCDAANGTYYKLYSDDRGVCRVYDMSIDDGEWRLCVTAHRFLNASSAASPTTPTRSSADGRRQRTARTT